MYAAIGSGKTKVCLNQAELLQFKAIYPYVKAHYVETYEEAIKWINDNQRGVFSTRVQHFGSASTHGGYINVEYFIDGESIYYNLWLQHFGKMLIPPDPENGVVVDNRQKLIKVKVKNTSLNPYIILHHGIAMTRILNIIGDFADVNFLVPDMSVYIAFTTYRGEDMSIRRIQQTIKRRLGGVSFTVKECSDC